MSDSLRPEPFGSPEGAGVEHDAKTEDLLLTGLDHYFAGAYQQAINVWTRVLFLDRGHVRARAYIERARSALAEQQRESEELLQSGVAAFHRGEIELARRLLMSSVDRGGPQEVALPILARVNRLEAAVNAVESAQRPLATRPPPGHALASVPPRSSNRARFLLALVVTLGATIGLVITALELVSRASDESPGSAPLIQPAEEPVPLAKPGEIALTRARRLFGTGHPTEALHMLELIRAGDPRRGDADRLRAEIQHELLSHTVPESAAPNVPAAVPSSKIPVPE